LSESVRSVDRALDILASFSREAPSLSLSEISQQTGISKSTVHRLLGTLESRRFLMKNAGTGKYQLGYRFLEMASPIMRDANRQWVSPYLTRLAEDCGETVDLATLDGNHVIYLQVVESKQRVKIAAAAGQRLPIYCTASGKAFLAYMPEGQVKKILAENLTGFTGTTHTLSNEIIEDLRETRRRGFAISFEEYEKDINAVAAPILDEAGLPILTIAIVGPSFRLLPERMNQLGETIQSAIKDIQQEVGLNALTMMFPRDPSWQ